MLMRLLIVLGSFAFSTTVFAEKLDRSKINTVLSNLNPQKVSHEGKEGVWFPTEEAGGVLWLLEEKLPESLDLVDLQDTQIIALKAALNSYKSAATLYKDTATFNQQALKIALSYFPELSPPQLSWYEGKPAFYIYGVLTGIAIVVVSAWVLDKAQVR